MKLSTFKETLKNLSAINFELPDGTMVPSHFHITEVGKITKHFIDCGGTERTDNHLSMQIWVERDTNHRLEAEKLLKIIDMSSKFIGNEDLEIEIEYQSETIGKYGLGMKGSNFLLTSKHTDCLAKSDCGIPTKEKVKLNLAELTNQNACTPGGGCC